VYKIEKIDAKAEKSMDEVFEYLSNRITITKINIKMLNQKIVLGLKQY
jgi:hypothetical protein